MQDFALTFINLKPVLTEMIFFSVVICLGKYIALSSISTKTK